MVPRFDFPPPPQVPEAQRSSGTVGVRYEDISQEGDLKLTAMPHALGRLFFREVWQGHPAQRAAAAQGILPILSRLVLETLEGPISTHAPLESEGSFALGAQPDDEGGARRLLLHIDTTLHGRRGRTHDPQPAGAGTRIPVGRVYAEHVFTKPFGPPSERKVTRLELDGASVIPDEPLDYAPAVALLELDEQVDWVDDGYVLDPVPHRFGLFHTDSNQHVNSLVYPVLFEEAMLRRMGSLGADTSRALAVFMDLGFRKPCFAGERVELWLRAFQYERDWCAVGCLAPTGVEPGRANVTCRLRMRSR